MIISESVEHFLAIYRRVVQALSQQSHNFVKEFYKQYFTFTFSVINYGLWKGIILQITSLNATIAWNFVDIFIIILSTAFASRLRQFRMKVQSVVFAKVFG